MVTTKMNWSGPNVIHFGRKSQFGPDQFILVETKSLWSSQNQFGQTKPFWTDQNCFGHIEGQGISHHFFLPKVKIQVQNGNRVLNRLVPRLKCMELAC